MLTSVPSHGPGKNLLAPVVYPSAPVKALALLRQPVLYSPNLGPEPQGQAVSASNSFGPLGIRVVALVLGHFLDSKLLKTLGCTLFKV